MAKDELDVAMELLEPSQDGRMGGNPGVKDLLLGAAGAMAGEGGKEDEVYRVKGEDAERYVSNYLDQLDVKVYEKTGEREMPDGKVLPEYDSSKAAVADFNAGIDNVMTKSASNVYVDPDTTIGDEVQNGKYAVKVEAVEKGMPGKYDGPGGIVASVDVGEEGVSSVIKEFVDRKVSASGAYDKAFGEGVGDNDTGSDLKQIYERLDGDR